MIYFNVLGHNFLILGSFERTTDLFEKRSSNYSDRMRLPMMVELYVSDSLNLKLREKDNLFQNEMGFQLWFSALRLVVAQTQEIISSVFQH